MSRSTRLACAAVTLAIVSSTACSTGSSRADRLAPASTTAPTRNASPIPDIVDDVSPSTVSIHTDSGNGSGVVWDAKGTIVTNEHVIRGARRLSVSLADGTHLGAELIAEDRITDLAILHVDRAGLPPATFRRDLPRVGELAIAIGNPLGFSDTVTAGIVSSLNRDIPGSAVESSALVDLIQTDAAISPGNSGGALVDGNGQVIGINVAYIPPEASAVSIGFAIPAPTVRDVVEQLLKNGTVSHAFMGLVPTTLTAQIRDSLGVHATSGVVVQSVVTGGPAANAGIAAGDVITAIDGKPIRNSEVFLAALRSHHPGDVVTVAFTRGTASHDAKVKLQDRPPSG